MTEQLKQLLNNYGLLYITLHSLTSERPGRSHDTLEQYYKSLGPITDDEPVVVVRISPDGEVKIGNKGEGGSAGNVSVWELPEDEFYFFRAFRPGLFQLEKELPQFLYGLGVVYAYATFEQYLAEVLRSCLRSHPKLMGEKKLLTYGDVFSAASKDELIEQLIGEGIRDLLYLPITVLLNSMREKLGFKTLDASYDDEVRRISLVRNCIVHNGAIAEARIAKEYPAQYAAGTPIKVTLDDVSHAIFTLRKLAWAIDFLLPKTQS